MSNPPIVAALGPIYSYENKRRKKYYLMDEINIFLWN